MAKRSKRAPNVLTRVKRIARPRTLAIAVAGLAGAWFAFGLAASGVMRIQDPAISLRFMPNESVALATRAEQLIQANPKNPPNQVHSMAITALRQQAINPRALRVLGYYTSAKGQDGRAVIYIRAAEAQSRRDSLTQLWLIENAVRKNNIQEALKHYDVALRTRPSTHAILFPILLSALDDPNIRTALAPYIRNERTWVPIFLNDAISNSDNLTALVDLMIESGGPADPEVNQRQNVNLLWRLVNDKHFADARRLYLRLPGADAGRLVATGLGAADRKSEFGPINWQMRTGSGSGGSLSADGQKRTALAIFAVPATTDLVATKILYLRPGDYDFSAALSNAQTSEGGFIRWRLRCQTAEGDQLAWTLDGSSSKFSASFSVPQGCPVQFLDIVASGGTGQNGMEATITDISIRPRPGPHPSPNISGKS